MKFRHVGASALFLVLASGAADAHFRLLAPASWIEENQLGDPQKAAPCGGTNADFGKPSYAVTEARGGSMLHIKVQETVFHPGHYRIAPFGAGSADEDESNAAQLWSTVFLALPPPAGQSCH